MEQAIELLIINYKIQKGEKGNCQMANGKTVKRCVGGAVDERRRIHATNTGEFLGMAWR